jgi:hypothetical protein
MFKILHKPKMRNQYSLSKCRRYFLSTFERVNRFKAKKMLNFFICQPPGEENLFLARHDNFQNVDKDEFLSMDLSTKVVKDGCDSSIGSIQNENVVCRCNSSSSVVVDNIPSKSSSHIEWSNLLAQESECLVESTGNCVDRDVEINRKMSVSTISSVENSTKMSTKTDSVDKRQKLLKISSFSFHLLIFSFVIFFQNCFLCANAKAKSDLKGRDDNGTDIEGKALSSSPVFQLFFW